MAKLLSPKQRSAVERAKRMAELRPLLFRKAKGVEWLQPFMDAGFLDAQGLPAPAASSDPGYVVIPVWPITDYLVSVAPELGTDEAAARVVMDFIRKASLEAIAKGISNYRVWWQFAKILCDMPVGLLTQADISMLRHWLNDPYDRGMVAEVLGIKWLPTLLSSIKVRGFAFSLVKELYAVRFVPRERGLDEIKSARLNVDSWHARNINKAIAKKIGITLGEQAVDFFRATLEQTVAALENDSWSSVWRPAIEDHEQNGNRDDAEHILVEAFRDVVAGFVSDRSYEARGKVSELLQSNFAIVSRIALNAIDANFESLAVLADAATEKARFTHNFRHELWSLLHHHYAKLPYTIREKIIEVIFEVGAEKGGAHPKSVAYQTAIWLSAIKDYSKETQQKYEQLVSEIGQEPDHPEFAAYISVGWVNDDSPVEPATLQALPLPALVNKLNAFQAAPGIGQPTVRGLAKALRQAVKNSPLHFIDKLEYFESLKLPYVYEAIEAFGELWGEKAKLPWDDMWPRLVQFCDRLISRPSFWVESGSPEADFVGTKDWIVGAIGRLIEYGSKSDDHSFPPALLPSAETIILKILAQQPGETFELTSDAVSLAINSPRGRCIEALINVALRSCRVSEMKFNEHARAWVHFQPVFDAELERRNVGEFEFATLVANYLPNFLFMSKEWVLRNLHRIFDANNYQAWLCAMQGYAYVSTVYQEIYGHLASSGHLLRALDDELLRDRAKETIVQHIAVAYLNNFEVLEDRESMIRTLTSRRKAKELSELIWFFWTLRDSEEGRSQTQKKVYALWRFISSSIDLDTKEGKEIASELCQWIAFVDQIDDNSRDLVYAALPFCEIGFKSHEVLESIARISRLQPKEASQLWLKLLEHSQSDYPEDAVESALTNIAKQGPDGIRAAKHITDQYLVQGNEGPADRLREILRTKLEAGLS